MNLLSSWLLVSLIGCAIGQVKGRPFAGFMWGLLLGPIGWLIVILGPNMKPKCPDCGGIVVEGAGKCKNCGADLLDDDDEEEEDDDDDDDYEPVPY